MTARTEHPDLSATHRLVHAIGLALLMLLSAVMLVVVVGVVLAQLGVWLLDDVDALSPIAGTGANRLIGIIVESAAAIIGLLLPITIIRLTRKP